MRTDRIPTEEAAGGRIFAAAVSGLEAVSSRLEDVCTETIQKKLDEKDYQVITIFTGLAASEEMTERICDFVAQRYLYTEFTVVQTDDEFYRFVLSFE